MTLYADDCSLYTSSSSLETVNANLNSDVERIKSWSKDNKMVINLDKFYSMLICTCQKLKHLSKNRLDICWGDSFLDNVSNHKHLGVVINNRLLWSQHISTLINKINFCLNVLNRIKKFLPFFSRMKYFDAFIGSHISYASTVLGGAVSGDINSLLITLKRCARSILDVGVFDSHIPLFMKLKWLSIVLIFRTADVPMTFQAINGLVPNYIRRMFTEVASINTHQMVSRTPRSNFYIPRANISLFKSSFAFNAAELFNSLPILLNKLTQSQPLKRSYSSIFSPIISLESHIIRLFELLLFLPLLFLLYISDHFMNYQTWTQHSFNLQYFSLLVLFYFLSYLVYVYFVLCIIVFSVNTEDPKEDHFT